jgi:putative endopeptidase
MTRLKTAAMVISGLIFMSACDGKTVVEVAEPEIEPLLENVDVSLIDRSISPGDDFYRFANGTWLSTYELPADKSAFGNFHELFETSQERVQSLIEELAAARPETGSVEQKIGDYYSSYLNEARINELGHSPIEGELAGIRSIDSVESLAAAFGRSDRESSISPIAFGIEIDRKDPSRFITGVGHSGIGLPERDYYLEETERFSAIRDSYQMHIARMLELVDYPDAMNVAAEVLRLETEIARNHWPRSDRRNRDLTYNLSTPAELAVSFPDFPWQTFFEASGVVPEVVNVRHPSAIGPLVQLVNDTPLSVWQAYLAYHLVSNNAPFLSADIDQANFEFYGQILRGQPEQRERWRRAVSLVSGGRGLGDAIGQVYVDRYFPPQSKADMQVLVENLRTALRQRIAALDWMGEDTKARAFEKLDAFLPKIGYPDEWRDFSSVEIDATDLMGNVRQLRAYFEADAIARLSQPTDRDEWFSPAQTVNAFYNPQFNAITFPAGILEPPFFNADADPAVNYGAIGAVIGHEMGHGFDDQGSKSDGRGIQVNWWTAADRERFDAKASSLAEQYSAYEAVPGTRIDGRFTLGENIGDLGGINIAYHAYRASLNGQEPPIIDGLTGDQRFFIAFAQLWRSMIREEVTLARLKSDPHAPPPYRANGVVRNVDAWYEAFDVDEDAALYLPPEERVSIW